MKIHRFLGMNLLFVDSLFWSFSCKKSHILTQMLGFVKCKLLKINKLNIFYFFYIFFEIFFAVCDFASIFATHLIGNKQNEKNHFRRCCLRYVRVRCLL